MLDILMGELRRGKKSPILWQDVGIEKSVFVQVPIFTTVKLRWALCSVFHELYVRFFSNLRNPSHIRIGEVWQHPNNFQWDKKLVKKLTTIPFRSLTNAAEGVDWYVTATVFVSSTGLELVDFVVLRTREKTIPVTETILARILQIRLGWPNMV